MTVAILPHGFPDSIFQKLADIPITNASVISNQKAEIERHRMLGDLSCDDDILMLVSSRALAARRSGLKCGVSLVLAEPPAIQQRYYRMLPLVSTRYKRIFTYSQEIVSQIKNAELVFHGGCSIGTETTSFTKTNFASIIASRKKTTQGHRLRHKIAEQVRKTSCNTVILGRGYNPVACVSQALAPFRFSVVIENSRYPGYFSEKLIDCLACKTIPIYWGDPHVDQSFDPRGIIQCKSESDIMKALSNLSDELYDQMARFVEENYNRSKTYRQHMLIRAANKLCEASSTKIVTQESCWGAV
jgi:hypothetical protein